MSSQGHYYLQLTIPSKKEDSRLVGRTVHLFCAHLGFDDVQSYQLELATVEAIHNIIDHAYSCSPNCMVELHVQGLDDRIVFTLFDKGQPADFDLAPSCPVRLESGIDALPDSSLGLYIINSVMDSVEYEVHEKSNILTMIKYLPVQ